MAPILISLIRYIHGLTGTYNPLILSLHHQSGLTPLMLAAQENNLLLGTMLLDFDANIDAIDEVSMRMDYYAMIYGVISDI